MCREKIGINIMIGLKRGLVELYPHEAEWEDNAAVTIEKLAGIFGTAAKDIQHVGSTSIADIKAKPIIDIAVAVDSFDDVYPLVPALEEKGFYRRRHEIEDDMLFVCGDLAADTRTHHIHVVKTGSKEWRNYINLRDYLKACPDIARQYEGLKSRLMNEYPNDRSAYTQGKAEFITKTLRDALTWRYLGKTVKVTAGQPLGTYHARTGPLFYVIHRGFVDGVITEDGGKQDAYIFGIDRPAAESEGVVIAVLHREDGAEDQWVVAPRGIKPNQAEIVEAVRFQEKYFTTHREHLYHKSCGMIIFRNHQGRCEYLLLHESNANVWSFPKGHMEAGETEIQTAMREVKEESGLMPTVLDGFRQETFYRIAPIYEKTVVLFLAQSTGRVEIKKDEIADYRWAGIEEAKALLKHRQFADILDKAERALQK